jgi:hypothetical protein
MHHFCSVYPETVHLSTVTSLLNILSSVSVHTGIVLPSTDTLLLTLWSFPDYIHRDDLVISGYLIISLVHYTSISRVPHSLMSHWYSTHRDYNDNTHGYLVTMTILTFVAMFY